MTVAPDGSDDLLNDDDYDRDNCDDDNDDGYDNAADDANFFALKNYKWSAPRRTSYTIARNCVAVPPKIDIALPGDPRVPLHMVKLNSHAQVPRPGDPPSSHA